MLTKSYKTKIRIQHSVLFVVLLVIGLTMLVPFFWTLSSSLKYDREIFEYPIKWIPEVLRWSNYEEVWTRVNFLTYYLNTIKLSLIVTIGQVVTCSLAAYSFAKMDYPGRDKIFLCYLATMMVPFELSVTPLYIMFSKIGWLNSYKIQIIPFTANVFAMFMIRQFMEGIPDSLVEAARIDGAGHFKIYYKIMVPICKPVMGSTTVLVALAKFNDYLWPKVVVQKQMYQPIMTVLPTLNEKNVVWNIPRELILTGCTIVIVPLIILFVCLQDLFMDSVAIGAVKE